MNLSIVIPVYNCKNHLEDCLRAVCASKGDFEIILVDDGSTDGSAIICDDFALKDDRIKVFHKKNGGVSSARNHGIKKSSGDYIMFVDADDILCKKWDRALDYAKNNDIVYFSSRCASGSVDKNTLLRYITGLNRDHVYLSGPYSKLYKRAFLVENNLYFDEELINGEDMLFNIRAAISAGIYEIVNLHFYLYRQTAGQATRRFDDSIIKSDKRFHKKLHEVFYDANVEKKLAKEIEDHCLSNAVLLILSRLSYADSFVMVKKYYVELEKEPYKAIVNENCKKGGRIGLLFRFCNGRKYRLLFLLLKNYNRFIMVHKLVRNKRFIKI